MTRTPSVRPIPGKRVGDNESLSPRHFFNAGNSQPLIQLVEEQPAARAVGLKPLPVDDQLRDSTFAHMPHQLCRGGRIFVHIDLGIRDSVCIEKLLGRPAIPAPRSGINLHFHARILRPSRC